VKNRGDSVVTGRNTAFFSSFRTKSNTLPFRGIIFICSIGVLFLTPFWLYAGGRFPTGDERRGLVAFYRGVYSVAVEEYSRLLAGDPENQKIARDLAAALMAAGQYHEAAKVLARAKIQGLELGEAKLGAADFSGAVREFEFSLENPGNHSRTRILLGLIDYYQGDYAEAAEHFWRAQEENAASSGTVHLLLGRAFHGLAESATTEHDYFIFRANEELRRAEKTDPSLWQVHRDLALFAEQNREWSKAINQWKQVRSVIGNAQEVKTAILKLKDLIPTPTITPTPPVVFLAAAPPPPRFEKQVLKPLPAKVGEPMIRVGLGRQLPSIAFGCLGGWQVLDHHGRRFWRGLSKTGYRIEQDPAGGWALKSWEGERLKRFRKKLILEPLDLRKVLVVIDLYQTTGYLWSVGERKTRYYRGRLVIIPHKKTLSLINQLSLEAYLLSVVPGEMPALWPLEGLKAQAIVARTDTLLRRKYHHKYGYDVCNTVHCAVYHGVIAEHPRTYQAVFETRGLVLKQGKKLMPTFYSHSCGGMTQAFQEAWGNKVPDPFQAQGVYDLDRNSPAARHLPLSPGEINSWLASSPQVFCNTPRYSASRNFRWMKILTREELIAVLHQRYGIGTVRQIKILERSPSAYVRKILVKGQYGKFTIRGDRIRSAMGGLRSNLFSILPIPDTDRSATAPRAWLVWGAGWGHGVGLCQVGAGEMARQGYSCTEILHHYFPRGEIQSWR